MLEHPIRADFALISALKGDRWGNLVYRRTARNFGPIMATAAATRPSCRSTRSCRSAGSTPRPIVTPGIFVDRVVAVGERLWLRDGVFLGGVDVAGEPLANGPLDLEHRER